MGAAGLAGIAGEVWADAAEFIGTRQFTRFSPTMSAELSGDLIAGWQRAVRATLSWARDRGLEEPKKRNAKLKKKASAKKKSTSARKTPKR
jgi:hypothetical protein